MNTTKTTSSSTMRLSQIPFLKNSRNYTLTGLTMLSKTRTWQNHKESFSNFKNQTNSNSKTKNNFIQKSISRRNKNNARTSKREMLKWSKRTRSSGLNSLLCRRRRMSLPYRCKRCRKKSFKKRNSPFTKLYVIRSASSDSSRETWIPKCEVSPTVLLIRKRMLSFLKSLFQLITNCQVT